MRSILLFDLFSERILLLLNIYISETELPINKCTNKEVTHCKVAITVITKQLHVRKHNLYKYGCIGLFAYSSKSVHDLSISP